MKRPFTRLQMYYMNRTGPPQALNKLISLDKAHPECNLKRALHSRMSKEKLLSRKAIDIYCREKGE